MAIMCGLQPLGAMGRAQEEAAGYIKSRCWQSVQCIRVLAALSVASHSEDPLGTAQLSEPTVGEDISGSCWKSGATVLCAAHISIHLWVSRTCGMQLRRHVDCAGAVTAVLASTVSALQAYAKTCVAAAPRGSALAQQSMGPDASGTAYIPLVLA